MAYETENPAAGSTPDNKLVPATPGEGHALQVRSEGPETVPEEDSRDHRLDRLGMQLDVLVKVRSLRVQDLLALEKGTVVETVHEHSQDVPVHCGGRLLVWAEFELVDQKLGVRVTRLA